MAQCGLIENRKGKTLPACKQQLDGEGLCPVHCRSVKRDKSLCVNHHVKGRRRCRMHGGKSRAGLTHPNTTTGKTSRYIGVLGEESGRIYRERLQDYDQLSLRPDIALLDMRIELLHKRVQRGEDDPQWSDAWLLLEAYLKAQVERDRDKALELLQKLTDTLRAGKQAEGTWAEIDKLAWQRRPQLVEKEVRMGVQVAEMIQRGVIINLLRLVAESVKRNVTEPQAIDIIIEDIVRLSTAAISGFSAGVGELSEAGASAA